MWLVVVVPTRHDVIALPVEEGFAPQVLDMTLPIHDFSDGVRDHEIATQRECPVEPGLLGDCLALPFPLACHGRNRCL